MKRWFALLVFLLGISSSAFAAPCGIVKVGYTDQPRPPFFLGSGHETPEPPGMAVELIRNSFAALNCRVHFKRYPPARLASALSQGAVDFSFVGLGPKLRREITVPTLSNGNVDRQRALHLKGVVFVRAKDGISPVVLPSVYFRSHALAAYKELQVFNALPSETIVVDYGGKDIWANFEKLRLSRVDGVMAALFDVRSMDEIILFRYQGSIVRMPIPLTSIDLTLATNASFKLQNPLLVAQTWNQIRDNWPDELETLMKASKRSSDDLSMLPEW